MSNGIERFQQAVAQYQQGDLVAAEAWREATAEHSASPARSALAAGSYCCRPSSIRGDALTLLTDQVQQFPKHPAGWHFLGALTFQDGKPKRAAHCFATLTQLQPDNAGNWLNLGKPGERPKNRPTTLALNSAYQLTPIHRNLFSFR